MTTWNPSDKSSSVVLSGGNLTATGGTNNVFHSVRGSTAQTSGKYYFEVTMVNPTNTGVGVANGSFPLDSTYLGQDANAAGYYNSGFASSPLGGSGTASYATYANADIISVALDVNNDLLWLAKNGVWQSGNPSTGTGGISTSPAGNSYYPVFSDQSSGTAGGGTANFGASAFTYTLPTGFSAWGGASGAISGSSSLAFSLSATLTGKGAITGTSTLVLSPVGTLSGKGALTGASPLSFSPAATIAGLAPISGTSSLSFTAAGVVTGMGALSAASSVTFSPTGTLSSAPTGLMGTASLSFTNAGNIRGLAPLTGSAAFTLSVVGALGSLGPLAGSASIRFTPSGRMAGPDGWTDTTVSTAEYVNDNPDESVWTIITSTGTWT